MKKYTYHSCPADNVVELPDNAVVIGVTILNEGTPYPEDYLHYLLPVGDPEEKDPRVTGIRG